jgi:tetratricopeptide (TPR) repeat protein
MDRSADEPLTPAVARDVARREQLKALLAGSIGSLGRNYVITLEAINAEIGDVMAREQAEAGGKEQVLTALSQAASRLREKLGESLGSIEKFDVPLPRATTPSLEALQAYSRALDEGRVSPRAESIPHLKRALEFDPQFALALALLSGVYANTGQSALAPEFSRRAFELRDRVSERERFFISWRYYRDAAQAWDKALELTQAWAAAYPREAIAFNSLGIACLYLGKYEEAIGHLREAIRLDPKFGAPYGNLGLALTALNRFDEAKSVLEEAESRTFELVDQHRTLFLVALIENDTSEMARQAKLASATSSAYRVHGWKAHASLFAGRFRAAREDFQRGIQIVGSVGPTEYVSQWTVQIAEADALAGFLVPGARSLVSERCPEVTREAAAGIAISRDNFTLERANRALALCGASRDVATLSTELRRRFPDATLTNRVMLPVASAALSLSRGDPGRALEDLEPARPYDHALVSEFWPAYLRGQAYLALKDGGRAAVEFQSILDHRGEAPASPLYPLAHSGLARAAVLIGDRERARAARHRFLALWAAADPDLPILAAARADAAMAR